MSLGVVSVRYARALLEYSVEQHVEDVMYENMHHLLSAFMQNREFVLVLQDPTLSVKEKVELLCSAVGSPIDEYRRFSDMLIRKGREEYIRFVAHAYIMLYRKIKNIIPVKLTTAYEPDSHLLQSIVELVKGDSQQVSVELDNVIDSSIIGGFVIDADSLRLDASVKGELNRIERSLVDDSRRLI